MAARHMAVFILILFCRQNLIFGASLGNAELFNETPGNDEEERRTVLENIQKNYYVDEFRNYEMSDIENFLNDFATPLKKERKPIYASKTFFGSDQFFGAHERSKDNSQHQAWNPFRANGVIETQPSYFDVPDDLFQQYIYSKNNQAPYSKADDEKASDFSPSVGDLSKDNSPFSEIDSTDGTNYFLHPLDEGTPKLLHDVQLPALSAEGLAGSVLPPEEGGIDSNIFHLDEETTEVFNKLLQSTMEGVDDEFEERQDSNKDPEDFSFQSVDVDAQMSDAPTSLEDGEESKFFSLDVVNTATVIQDTLQFSMPSTKEPNEDPRHDHVLHLDEQNINESHLDKIENEHLEKVQSNGDSGLIEFIEEKNFDKTSNVVENRDLDKLDINELQGSGDMKDGFDAVLEDTELESKSGRIIEFFPRMNIAAECTTPKGEKGRCRSLTQCPLSETLTNFNLLLQYVCLSRGVLVGICCPDNPVVEISDSTETENSTGISVAEFKHPIEGCGLNSNTRIVGGKVSLPHEWTWMVALLRRNRFFCGGVIINDWYILTAAHCVMGIKLKDLTVRVGEYNFNEKNEHHEDIPVAEIKRHALFVTLTFQHDIALLKLKRRIEYTKFIGSICLPNPKSGNFSNVNATVVGWGTVAFGGSASPILRQVTVPVWDNNECDKTYRLERITNAFICAGSPENGEDACQGDSGGPLMALGEEGRWEVIGIVSWGRRCGDPTFPGVYTRVTSYLDWITENTS